MAASCSKKAKLIWISMHLQSLATGQLLGVLVESLQPALVQVRFEGRQGDSVVRVDDKLSIH